MSTSASRRVCVAALVAGFGAGGFTASAGVGKHDSAPALDVSDAAIFSQDHFPNLEDSLLDSDFLGVALRGPAQVDVASRTSLPLLLASRLTGKRSWALPPLEHMWLLGAEMGTDKVLTELAFKTGKTPAPRKRAANLPKDQLADFGAKVSKVDARSLLALPWQPSCWRFSLLYYDMASNPVAVRLVRAGAGQASNASCAVPPMGKVTFRVTGKGGNFTVQGQYDLPVEVLGAGPTPVSLLIVSSDGEPPQEEHFTLDPSLRQGQPSLRGAFTHAFSPDARPAKGAVAYLLLAGRLYGPSRL
jgi:hypothetical protein